MTTQPETGRAEEGQTEDTANLASLEAERDQARAELAKANDKLRRREQRITSLTSTVQRERAALRQARSDLARARAAVDAPPPLFFIVGQAKSGTSWVMRILDAHPDILAKGEGRFFGRSYKRADVRRIESRTLQPSSLYRAILDADYLRSWVERSVWTRDRDVDTQLDELTRAATVHFLTTARADAEARIVGDKTPFLDAEMLGELASILPAAKVIHVIRDGRDVAVSAIHHLWNHRLDLGGSHDLTAAEAEIRESYRADPDSFGRAGRSIFTAERLALLAEAWRTQVSRARLDGPQLLGDRYTEVRFEGLLNRGVAEARRLLGFLGVDSRADVARSCVDKARFERWSKGRGRGHEDSVSFFRKGIAGDWRNVFTERDDSIFVEEAGELLAELGYAVGDDDTARP